MKHLIVGVALAAASLLAMADGTPQQYEQAAVNQAALDPNEAIVNDDGAVENPNAKMSGTARAYRNGYYNGKNAQREQDEQANNPPPLPPDPPAKRVVAEDDQSRYTSIPPQDVGAPPAVAQVQRPYGAAYPAPSPAQPAYPAYLEQPRPAAPVNVYVQAPQPQQYYAPPPPPQPVYEAPEEAYAPPPGPPQSTYVIVRGVPPALATGYWPRGYQPVYPPVPRRPVYYYGGGYYRPY
jgi:hypothetical protein